MPALVVWAETGLLASACSRSGGSSGIGWFRPQDPAALADPHARNRDALAARRPIETRFSLDAMARAYEGLYERLRPAD